MPQGAACQLLLGEEEECVPRTCSTFALPEEEWEIKIINNPTVQLSGLFWQPINLSIRGRGRGSQRALPVFLSVTFSGSADLASPPLLAYLCLLSLVLIEVIDLWGCCSKASLPPRLPSCFLRPSSGSGVDSLHREESFIKALFVGLLMGVQEPHQKILLPC